MALTLRLNCKEMIFTPTALRIIAQGCREATTLGQKRDVVITPTGLWSGLDRRFSAKKLHNPGGVEEPFMAP